MSDVEPLHLGDAAQPDDGLDLGRHARVHRWGA